MLDVGANYPNKSDTTFCPVCEDKNMKDTQEHLMICPQLVENTLEVQNVPSYEDLFKDNISKQIQIASIIQSNFRRRKKIMANKTSSLVKGPSEPSGVLQVTT
jgi:hypothetical protein